MDDIEKTRALLRLVSATDGSVTLAGPAAAQVADALGQVEALRGEVAALTADRARLQALCDKTALAAANRTLQRLVNEGERLRPVASVLDGNQTGGDDRD